MLQLFRLFSLSLVVTAASARAAIGISGVADKTKYDNTAAFTVTTDPNAATTAATLDGIPVPLGVSVPVTAISFHELRAESRTAGGALVDSRLVRFIVRNNAERGGSEDGIPTHTPFRTVNDAPGVGALTEVVAVLFGPVRMPVPLTTCQK